MVAIRLLLEQMSSACNFPPLMAAPCGWLHCYWGSRILKCCFSEAWGVQQELRMETFHSEDGSPPLAGFVPPLVYFWVQDKQKANSTDMIVVGLMPLWPHSSHMTMSPLATTGHWLMGRRAMSCLRVQSHLAACASSPLRSSQCQPQISAPSPWISCSHLRGMLLYLVRLSRGPDLGPI